ncbi:MAG TPA: sortase [Nocardioides sp.]|uniref:sortase domain-containing protein n=1 Tax=Nocardioides sp. TaxID=35761 RepID=UPI002BFB3241|nr:sortase [Nocardioides sp.]HTW14814.1 sortase [Nocardioides sp.]
MSVSTLPGRTVVHGGAVDASPPGTADRESLRLTLSHVLLGLSGVVVWFLVYLLVLSGVQQGRAQSELYDQLRTDLAAGTAPTGAPIAPGRPIALLAIPDAGVDDLVVVEGTGSRELMDGPGHVPGTVLPGQQGVSVVAGRSLTFGAPFGRLSELRPGDPVTVTTAQGEFVYAVAAVRRSGDPVPAPLAAGGSRLTLRTSGHPDGGLASARPGAGLYVDAVLATGAVPASGVAPAQSGDHLMAVQVDAASLALLALALQLLILALGGLVWAWSRWSRTAAWIAGGPVVLAALWLVASQAAVFLPALV